MEEGDAQPPRPVEQIVVATVQLVNHVAESAGLNGRLTPKPLQAMLKFRNRSQGRASFLQVSTRKDTLCPKFDVDSIRNIRSTLLEQGMITIETNQMSILVKDGKPQELQSLLSAINLAKSQQTNSTSANNTSLSTKDKNDQTACGSSRPRSSEISIPLSRCQNNMSPQSDKVGRKSATISTPTGVGVERCRGLSIIPKKILDKYSNTKKSMSPPSSVTSDTSGRVAGPLRQSILNFQSLTPEQKEAADQRRSTLSVNPAVKRVRSPSPPSKEKKATLKKALSTKGIKFVYKIDSKIKYLQGFSEFTTNLSINNISMKKLDSRLLALQHLRHLDLANNSLTNVDPLRQLNSTLDSLKLSHNQISTLDPRLRFSWSKLTILDLSHNILKMLPDSFVFLNQLRMLDVSHNSLLVLPFNIHLLRGLRTLLANDNQLQFAPDPMSSGIVSLEKVDLSNNPKMVISPPANVISTGWGSTNDNVPSLMELCAAVVLADVPNRQEWSFGNWPQGVMPLSLTEYLYRAKRCGRCRAQVTRYVYKDYMGYGRSLAQQITADGPQIRMRSVFCPHHISSS